MTMQAFCSQPCLRLRFLQLYGYNSMIYRIRDMIYGKCRMIYSLCKYDMISVPEYAKRISSAKQISYPEGISSVTAGNGYHCKKPLLSTRQKRFFTCERAAWRCVIVGKKSEKVHNRSVRQIGFTLSAFRLLLPWWKQKTHSCPYCSHR